MRSPDAWPAHPPDALNTRGIVKSRDVARTRNVLKSRIVHQLAGRGWGVDEERVHARAGICGAHGRRIEISCDRCGDLVCQQCFVALEHGRYCQPCFVSGRVGSWLQDFRSSLWGKRDGSAWLVLLGVAAYLAVDLWLRMPVALGLGLPGVVTLAGPAIVWMSAAILFFSGLPNGRTALLVAAPLRCTIEVFAPIARQPHLAVLEALCAVVLTTIILADTRNRMFFKLPVSDDEVRDLHQNVSNRWARHSLFIVCALSIAFILNEFLIAGPRVGLLILLSLAALTCGLIGLRKVNPSAEPPIGGRGRAVGGTFLSLLWLLFLVAAR